MRLSNSNCCYLYFIIWICIIKPNVNIQREREREILTVHVLHSTMKSKDINWVRTVGWKRLTFAAVRPFEQPTGSQTTARRRRSPTASPRTSMTRRTSPRSLRWAARTVLAVAPRIMRTSGDRRPRPHHRVRTRNEGYVRQTSDPKTKPNSGIYFLRRDPVFAFND